MYQKQYSGYVTIQTPPPPERRSSPTRSYVIIADGQPGAKGTKYGLYVVLDDGENRRYARLGLYNSSREAEEAARILAPPRRNIPSA